MGASPLMGASNVGLVGRNHDSEPTSGLTACVNTATQWPFHRPSSICRSGFVYASLKSPCRQGLTTLRLVETSCCLAPDDVSATEHSASPVLLRGTACRPIFELHQHYQLLKTVSRLICFCSLTLYSLI